MRRNVMMKFGVLDELRAVALVMLFELAEAA